MGGKPCAGDHLQHICKLAEDGKLEDIKQLVKDTKYICENCGRAANAEENLCSPIDVDASRYM